LSVTQDADTIAADGATVLFGERAADGWDAYDASQLPPPTSSSHVMLSSPIQRDGDLVQRLQASRAYSTTTDSVTVPLSVQAVQTGGTARLGWPEEKRTGVPDDWTVVLEDTKTDSRTDLRREDYEFALSAGDGSSLSRPEEARFRLHVAAPAAIPVELTGLDVGLKEKAARLTWQTASETNNAGFVVQRQVPSADGSPLADSEWRRLGFVESKAQGGSTSRTRSYRFTDRNLPYAADSLTYRLRQVDTDGTARLSGPVTVRRGPPKRLSMQAPFPNPAGQQVTLHFALPKATSVRIGVYDLLGREVATVSEGRRKAGRHESRLHVGAWAAGTYFLRLQAGEEVQTRRLTVVR
jgi:hypothetical protein